MGLQRVGHHWATFTFTHPSSPYSALSNHLMPTLQREFSLSEAIKNWLLTHEKWRLSLFCQEVSPLCSQCPYYLYFSFLVNSLRSEMLCVWKFFSSPSSDCLNKETLLSAIHLFDIYLLTSLHMPSTWLDHQLKDCVLFVHYCTPNTWYNTWHTVGAQ